MKTHLAFLALAPVATASAIQSILAVWARIMKVILACWIGVIAGLAHASNPQCPLDSVVKMPSGERCAYVVNLMRIDATIGSRGLLELPTYIMVKAWEQVPLIGYFVSAAFEAESERQFRATLKAPTGYEDYLRAGQRESVYSITGSDGYGWSHVDDHAAVFRFALRKKGMFEGRSWIHGRLVMVLRHPSVAPSAKDVETIVTQAIAAEDARLAAQAAAAAAAERPARHEGFLERRRPV